MKIPKKLFSKSFFGGVWGKAPITLRSCYIMSTTVAFSTVALMLLYAVPGFLLVKTGAVHKGHISSFAKLLMYVCQPALVINSITKVSYSPKTLGDMAIVFAFMFLSQGIMMTAAYAVLRKKTRDPKYRIYSIATAMANCSFMGIPLLEALLPEHPEAVSYSAVASLALNILGWTLASAVITNDRKHISVKKLIFNPTVLAFIVAVPLFVTGWSLPWQLPSALELLSKMTTPLCMFIMGMRLATSSFKGVFANPAGYAVIAIKQLIFPATAFLILLFLPIDPTIKASVYIMLSCPVASVVLNFSEMLGEGQKTAADLVLLGTLLSTVTLPAMMLLMGYLL